MLKALNDDPTFASVSHERMLALLSRQSVSFTRSELIKASKAATGLDLDAALAQRVYDALPFDGDDAATKSFVYLALEAGIRACNADEAFKEEARSAQLLHLVQAVARVDDKVGRVDQKMDMLIKQWAEKARELHLTEQLFISLAKRIASDVPDNDQAYRELERAVDVASDEQARGALSSNTDEAITAILARVDELNNAGQIDEAATHVDDEWARAKAGLIRLADTAIAQAVLTRDVNMACDYEIKKIAIDAAEPDEQFGAPRSRCAWESAYRSNGLKLRTISGTQFRASVF